MAENLRKARQSETPSLQRRPRKAEVGAKTSREESQKPKPGRRGGRGGVSPLSQGQPRAEGRARACQSLHAAGGGRAVGAGDRRRRQQGDARLFAVADTPQKMVALGEEKVRENIKTIGLYRNKAKNVIALSQKLIAEFGGEVPRTREALESLPGVGRKTANVVLNMAFGEPTMAVDTHVFRVGNRTGLAPGKTPLEVELGLVKRRSRRNSCCTRITG